MYNIYVLQYTPSVHFLFLTFFLALSALRRAYSSCSALHSSGFSPFCSKLCASLCCVLHSVRNPALHSAVFSTFCSKLCASLCCVLYVLFETLRFTLLCSTFCSKLCASLHSANTSVCSNSLNLSGITGSVSKTLFYS
jgi:hypothetical protein